MVFAQPTPATLASTTGATVGEWFLKGFADAYSAHWAVVPSGLAGDQYKRGYALGVEAVRREFLEALNRVTVQQPSAIAGSY